MSVNRASQVWEWSMDGEREMHLIVESRTAKGVHETLVLESAYQDSGVSAPGERTRILETWLARPEWSRLL